LISSSRKFVLWLGQPLPEYKYYPRFFRHFVIDLFRGSKFYATKTLKCFVILVMKVKLKKYWKYGCKTEFFTNYDSRPQVGIFRKKYNPRKPNTVSGAQAASSGGNCPTAPIASVSADAAQ
jgi:hypothetical protein